MSPELETLDQLLGCELSLGVISALFPSREEFEKSVLELLRNGDVLLINSEDKEVPNWRWRELFSDSGTHQELESPRLKITPLGVRRIA
jgi:hypothetical protein